MNYQGNLQEPGHFKMHDPRERTVSRTWRVPVSLVDRLYAKAGELRVYPSELVTWLVAKGLDQLDAGTWTVPTVPAHRCVIVEEE